MTAFGLSGHCTLWSVDAVDTSRLSGEKQAGVPQLSQLHSGEMQVGVAQLSEHSGEKQVGVFLYCRPATTRTAQTTIRRLHLS